MSKSTDLRPEIIVFAGPNGSGKSTITEEASIIKPYINADDIQRSLNCTDLEAANFADELRAKYVEEGKSFTFETVLSTDRKLIFLRDAKEKGYFIRGFFVLTADVNINVARVAGRVAAGGHDVKPEKIRSRYVDSLARIPQFMEICDILHIYDNTEDPFRIFKKRKADTFIWANEFWDEEAIKKLTGIE